MPFAVGRHTCIGNHFALGRFRSLSLTTCKKSELIVGFPISSQIQ